MLNKMQSVPLGKSAFGGLNTEYSPKANRFSSGKKLLILTFILIVSFTSMSFRECGVTPALPTLGAIIKAISGGKQDIGDNGTDSTYSIYVGENGVIYRSINDNNNIIFEQKTSGTTQRLNDVRIAQFTATGTVLAVGNNGAIVHSINTGNNWSVAAPVTSANLYGAEFNSTYYYAVGDNGTVLLSINGVTWGQIPSGTTRNLKAIGLNPESESIVIAVGEKGTILRSTSGGLNWTNISLADTTITFYDISQEGIYFEANIMCIVGNGGRIYKSTNNGATWVQKPSGTTNTLRSIYFHTVDSAVVVGDNGTLRLTTNGGETWFTDAFFNSPSTRNFKAVSLVNRDHYTFSALSDTLWFVSNDPITLGIEPISSEVPNGFSLSQNYPNPFNPNTKIKFQIAKVGQTFLSVYDALGKEVATLVNEKLQAGTYEVDFDGSKYSSGIYFYKLTSGDFTETRKMVLIK